MINRRTKRIAAVAVGLSLIAAACGDDEDDAGSEPATEEESATAESETSAEVSSKESAPAVEAAMRITYTLSDTAVWSDGTPMSAADFQCTFDAAINTPGSLNTIGYDRIVGVSEGASAKEVVVEFAPAFAAAKGLFNVLLKADAHADCNDVSQDFAPGPYAYGAGAYSVTEWTAEQQIWEKSPGYIGEHTGGPDRIVFVPSEGTTDLANRADFIYPQAYTGIDDELTGDNLAFDAKPGGQFEALYFQQDAACEPNETRSCAFADPIFKVAFAKSIDIDGVYEQIYAPFAQGTPLLTCGPIAPGPYCDPVFGGTYDPEGAATLLGDNGWTQGADGMWVSPDGETPVVHFMVNSGNTRRESTQEFLIPKLTDLGFSVQADNCEALPCVFQNRLPALQYDLAMFINTVAPDPVYLSNWVCDQIPSEANDFQGFNNFGWCNPEADALFAEADQTLDFDARAALVKQAIALMAQDFAILPTLQFPNIGAYRTDKVEGTQSNLANYWAFKDWWNFVDVDGDGQVVLGAEQYAAPECTNPVTECASSSWFQWMAGFPNFPGMYDTTDDQAFVPSEFLAGEAVVEEL